MLNAAGHRTVACGNIGMPFAEAVQRQGEFDIFTVEVSSFQLETISTFRPTVAVWLNLTPDHLDRYSNLAEYRTAKLRIFENQRSSDYAVTNYLDDLPGVDARQITFSAYSKEADFILQGDTIRFRGEPILEMKETHLTGIHNAENLMAALGAAQAVKIPWDKAKRGLITYRLLPHRCEKVGEIDGVIFINDSKATNLDALVKALESQPKPVVLIAGGKDKGFEFDAIAGLVHAKAKHAVLIGEMADRIFQTWSKVVPCSCAKTLRAAVDQARQLQPSGRCGAFLTGNIFIRHVQKLCRSRQSIPRNHSGVSKVRIIRKPLKVTPRKKLRAAAQRSAAKYAEEDYSAEEPNVKLSRAFVVVLLLHVVAVGGIFAFSALKDHQTGSTPGKAEAANQKASSDARQRRHENQGRRINPPAKQFRRTSKNWWIAHTASGGSGAKIQNNGITPGGSRRIRESVRGPKRR